MPRDDSNTPQGGLKNKTVMSCKKARTRTVPGLQFSKPKLTKAVIYNILSLKLRLAKRVTIPSLILTKIYFLSNFGGLDTIEPSQDTMENIRLLVAKGAI